MSLYLVRHAHAVTAAVDSRRPLSELGREQTRSLGAFARRAVVPPPGEVWHSSLARARETAELLVNATGWTARLVCVDDLLGEADPRVMVPRLKVTTVVLALVGHDPHLSALASLLVAGVTAPARFILKKGAMLALSRNEGVWSVRWQVSPETLR